MGVKGLQSFMQRCCPEACVTVNLRVMASQHAARNTPAARTAPTLVVDGMACLRHWYTCENWVSGGQWREYMEVLRNWVEAFNSSGIRLVFFFDGLVEEQKTQEWVKRRRRVSGQISKIFRHIKEHGEQPGRQLFNLPSGLATFTGFALRSLGQEVFCSVQEADYEIASYARQNCCMGILGQDSDFIIYDSAPYFSLENLKINRFTTVLYDRQKLCRSIGLAVSQLPLLACLLGNDVVPKEQTQHIRDIAMATYRKNNPALHLSQRQTVLAVSQYVSSLWGGQEEETEHILQCMDLSAAHRELLKRGMCSYSLPGQDDLPLGDVKTRPSAIALKKYVSPETLKACREKHVAMEGFMAYPVVFEGVMQCSNTLEDEEDDELLPQALVFKPCRQRIYGLLLSHQGDTVDTPAIKEWFVFPGNPLKEPDMVHPVPLNLPCGHPDLDLLWFGTGSDVSALRLASFLAILDCQDFTELYGTIEDSLLAALCLVTHIVLQVQAVSQEDVDAYLSQAVCLSSKSPLELQYMKLPFLSSRAVQLGSLYVRGLCHLLGANCASGYPLPNAALMPWHSFDGKLFQSKYLLAHSGTETTVLLDCDSSHLSLFLHLREKLMDACRKRSRVLQSRPKPFSLEQSPKTPSVPWHRGRRAGCEGWRTRGNGRGEHQHGDGWRGRGEERRDDNDNRDTMWDRRGGGRHSPSTYPDHHSRGLHNMNHPPRRSSGRWHRSRGGYRLAPRWSQPPAPGAQVDPEQRAED